VSGKGGGKEEKKARQTGGIKTVSFFYQDSQHCEKVVKGGGTALGSGKLIGSLSEGDELGGGRTSIPRRVMQKHRGGVSEACRKKKRSPERPEPIKQAKMEQKRQGRRRGPGARVLNEGRGKRTTEKLAKKRKQWKKKRTEKHIATTNKHYRDRGSLGKKRGKDQTLPQGRSKAS